MQTKLFALTIALTLFAAACVTAPEAAKETKETVAAQPAAMPEIDYAAIAQKIVAQCAGIKEGEIVEISGEIKDNELLRELSHAVRKLGAFPLVQTYKQDIERQKRMMLEMPAKWDSQVNQLGLKLAGFVNANINLANAEPFNAMEDFPQERLAAMQKANEPISNLRRQRNVRNIVLGGNGLYPSKANAERLGLTQAELAQIFWNGVNTDYTQLQAEGEKYRQMLAAAKEVHLTHPNGTDLKVKIEKRPVFVSDGVVSADDVKRGGAATTVWLPAGEVFVTPVPGTAEGRIVVDHDWYTGVNGHTPIEGLTFDFKAGKLVSMTARSGLEPMKKQYDKVTGKAAEGKDEFGVINLGINRNLVLGPKAKRGDYAPAGMVSVGFGGNEGYGGENKAGTGWESNLPGCTLKLDGRVVVENGVLK
jgi:leucyl aminopeptidase (aminopeptidase T)